MPCVKESRSSVADLRSFKCCFFRGGKKARPIFPLCQLYLACSAGIITTGGFGVKGGGVALLKLFVFSISLLKYLILP